MASGGIQIFGVMLSYRIPDAETVAIFHNNGYHVSSYQGNPREILRCVDLGVDVILVDDIYQFD